VIVKEKTVRLTQHQRTLLQLLAQHQEVTIGALAALLGISSVAATKNVHRLEEKRLVMRVEDKWDRRRTLIVLTDAGQSIVNDKK
jgi:DNA-binding MarR family transcriptional regulator